MMKKLRGWVGLSALLALVALVGCGSAQKRQEQGELRTSSDDTNAQKLSLIHLQLAVGYFGERKFEAALDNVKQALLAEPELADAYGVRALIYMELNETKLAEDNFIKALRITPNNPDLQNNYGLYLCQNGREKESIVQFETAVQNRSYSSPAKALNNAGACSLKLQKTVEAERYFLNAFRADPGNGFTNLNLAKLYFQRAEMTRAEFYISRMIKDVPGDQLPSEVLWLALKVYRKMGDNGLETSLGTQLRRHHPSSPEYSALLRGDYNE
jgi:type IV pilus assembly protein PilF